MLDQLTRYLINLGINPAIREAGQVFFISVPAGQDAFRIMRQLEARFPTAGVYPAGSEIEFNPKP